MPLRGFVLAESALALLFLGCTTTVTSSSFQEDTAQNSVKSEQSSLGEQLYTANCQGCHGGDTGGSMMDIPPPHNTNGHTWHHPDCQLVQTVLNGSGEMGEMMREMMGASEDTPRMPAFEGILTEDEIVAILDYIKGWWTEEQRHSQAVNTQQTCSDY